MYTQKLAVTEELSPRSRGPADAELQVLVEESDCCECLSSLATDAVVSTIGTDHTGLFVINSDLTTAHVLSGAADTYWDTRHYSTAPTKNYHYDFYQQGSFIEDRDFFGGSASTTVNPKMAFLAETYWYPFATQIAHYGQSTPSDIYGGQVNFFFAGTSLPDVTDFNTQTTALLAAI